MRRTRHPIVLLILAILAVAGQARGQIDCGVPGGCTTTKYGLGIKPDFRDDEFPPDPYRWRRSDFGPDIGGVSYSMERTDPDDPTAIGTCGPERHFRPLPGMVFLREQTGCLPTGTGPRCLGGANAGKDCHLSINPLQAAIECPDGTCADPGGGCRVEIPLENANGGLTPVESTSELKLFTRRFQAPAPGSNPRRFIDESWESGMTFGGTSATTNSLGQACPLINRRLRPSMATRYVLPESRRTALGLAVGATYVRWDGAFLAGPSGLNLLVNPSGCVGTACRRANEATNFRFHSDDHRRCCTSAVNVNQDCHGLATDYPYPYPLLRETACHTTSRSFWNDDNLAPDWVFTGGRDSAFFTDPQHVNPGQFAGLCREHRTIDCYLPNAAIACSGNKTPFQCCTGFGTGTCGDPCPGMGDTCDFTEPGHRVQVACGYDSQGDPRRDCCGNGLHVLRGTPNRHCSLLPRMPYDGDPGPRCQVDNYGIDVRYDDDCDGVADHADDCPLLHEWDQGADADGDCPGPSCRGDECECGDLSGGPASPFGSAYRRGDGRTTVADLVAINLAVFNPLDSTRNGLRADTDGNAIPTVSDLVGLNLEIYRPASSICPQVKPLPCPARSSHDPPPERECCGNGLVSSIESCDDENLVPGDGCDHACRIEPGFACSGEPSSCGPLL
jgi:cysteine-rich repeat protein